MNKLPPFKELIIYEDNELVFINKPAFISSLNERNNENKSIISIAKKFNNDLQLCHRLDKETSGILVLSKNAAVYRDMAIKFEHREIDKTYHAIVEGSLSVENKSIHIPLAVTKKGIAKVDLKEGRPSETIFSTIKLFKHFTLLSCKPITGRLHQIRIHLASQNFPISGDLTYGGQLPLLSNYKKKYKVGKFENENPMIKRVALHAFELKFELNGKNYEISAPYPKDFDVFLKQIEKFEC